MSCHWDSCSLYSEERDRHRQTLHRTAPSMCLKMNMIGRRTIRTDVGPFSWHVTRESVDLRPWCVTRMRVELTYRQHRRVDDIHILTFDWDNVHLNCMDLPCLDRNRSETVLLSAAVESELHQSVSMSRRTNVSIFTVSPLVETFIGITLICR